MPANRARASAFAAALLIALAVPAATAPPAADLPPILIARQLAEQEHLHAGDTVTLAQDPRGTRARQFRVAGIYEPTPDPMRFTARRIEARMHLPDLMAIAADMVMTPFGKRSQLYERLQSGEVDRMRQRLYNQYQDKTPAERMMQFVKGMDDDR